MIKHPIERENGRLDSHITMTWTIVVVRGQALSPTVPVNKILFELRCGFRQLDSRFGLEQHGHGLKTRERSSNISKRVAPYK